MILHPLQNQGIFANSVWIQRRPYITQSFGARPDFYKQFGHKGHNGVDYRAVVGTPLFAPFEGKIKVYNQGTKGYGLYVEVIKDNLKVILAHLSEVLVADGDSVRLGQVIALTGNTGLSSAPHLHMTLKFLKNGKIMNADNGYSGAVDHGKYLLTWKGTERRADYRGTI